MFDGQRLAMTADEPPATIKPAPVKPATGTGAAPRSGRCAEPRQKARRHRRCRRCSAVDSAETDKHCICNALGPDFSCDFAESTVSPAAPGCPAALSHAYWPHEENPFRLTPYQVQWLLIVGFLTVGYALYLRYLAIEFSTVALACDAGLQTMLCKTRILATYLFKNSVFGIAALVIAVLHLIRPSIVLLTGGLIAAGFGIVLYNIGLSGLAIGLLILGFARPAPATA